MPSEVTRCTECGTILKAIPSWMAGTSVNFTCTACPRRSKGLAAARFEPAGEQIVESHSQRPGDSDSERERIPDLEDLDEASDGEASLDEADEPAEHE